MLSDYKLLFRNNNFLYLWSSQILSQITINILNFILLIRLFDKTGSSIATSFLWVAYALPAILIGPVAAASIDMMDKKNILLVTNLLQSFTILLFAYLHESALFLLYAVVLAYSFLNQFYVPGESSALPALVSKNNLAQANGLFFITQQGALIVGFGVAGVLLKILGFSDSLYLCSAMLFLAYVACIFLPKMPSKSKIPQEFTDAVISFFLKIKEGYDFIKNERNVLLPLLLLMSMQITLAIITVNIPAIARDVFQIPLDRAGIIIIVPASLGAILAALIVPKALKKSLRKIIIIKSSMKSLIGSLFLQIILLPFLNNGLRIVSGFFLIMILGFSFIGVLIPAQTFLQEKTPVIFRGRVFGNYWFLVTVATLFPVVLSGTITEILGVEVMIILLGILFLLGYVYMTKNYKLSGINNN